MRRVQFKFDMEIYLVFKLILLSLSDHAVGCQTKLSSLINFSYSYCSSPSSSLSLSPLDGDSLSATLEQIARIMPNQLVGLTSVVVCRYVCMYKYNHNQLNLLLSC